MLYNMHWTGRELQMRKKNETFEELVKRLELIVERMERGDIDLDESIRLYEEGLNKSTKLTEMLTATRARIQQLIKQENGSLGVEDINISSNEEDNI